MWIRKKAFLWNFQSPDVGLTAWDQKQFQGKRQMLSVQESEMPVVSLRGAAAG